MPQRSQIIYSMLLLPVVLSCSFQAWTESPPFVVVLGIAQDAGLPHPACQNECCLPAWGDATLRRHVSSLAVVDPLSNERWLFDASPDFPAQLQMLNEISLNRKAPNTKNNSLASALGVSGIFLTHAHTGHYTGLMYLGREGVASQHVPVYAMSRMGEFLRANGPWSQLVSLGNIELHPLEDGVTIRLNARISVTPFRVPHRDEFSETVGFLVKGPEKSFLYIPDIDKWERWSTRLEEMLADVDMAFIDGTFFADGEIIGRSVSEIPHPFVSETMQRLRSLPVTERAKIFFIHLNHTNPALKRDSKERRAVVEQGFHVAEERQKNNL